jgi:hypothetical protein
MFTTGKDDALRVHIDQTKPVILEGECPLQDLGTLLMLLFTIRPPSPSFLKIDKLTEDCSCSHGCTVVKIARPNSADILLRMVRLKGSVVIIPTNFYLV